MYLHSRGQVYKNITPDVFLLESDDSFDDGINIKLINVDIQNAVNSS